MREDQTPLDPPWSLRERLSVAWDRASVRWFVGIVTAAVIVVALLAMRSMPVESSTTPKVVRSGTPIPSSGAPSQSAGASNASASTSGTPGVVVVHVTGPVRSPGVFTLPTGSRVNDAIGAAGGILRGPVRINLARVLIDGEQIDVSAPGDGTAAVGSSGSTATGPAASGAGQSGTGQSGAGQSGTGLPGAKISLNKATSSQLEQLPRVGPVLASKIIEFRTQHGGFRSVDQLREVSGIGDATFAQIAPYVQV